VVFPDVDGGGEWGGPGFDPETGMLYVNSNEMASLLKVVEKPDMTTRKEQPASVRRALWPVAISRTCGEARRRSPRLSHREEVQGRCDCEDYQRGQRRMPIFALPRVNVIAAVAHFLATGKNAEVASTAIEQLPHPRHSTRSKGTARFKDPTVTLPRLRLGNAQRH